MTLTEKVREVIRREHKSARTEEAYVHWTRQFVAFHQRRHPREMGAPEVVAFLNHLASVRDVSASTQNQALCALVYLYKKVLERDMPELDGLVRARRPENVPTVLAPEEARALLARLTTPFDLIGSLLYGCGLRLSECLGLRVKDIDFARHQITIHRGKGAKDRPALLPRAVAEPLRQHIDRIARRHAAELRAGFGDIRTVQTLLGHKDVRTTMIYTHVLDRGPLGVTSPLDR